MNSNGDLYIGNTIINAVTGKTTENQITELETLTITNNLNVIGGSGNTIATNFQSPVNFSNNILGDGGDYIFSNLQLRNSSGFTTVMTAVEGTNFLLTADTADIGFNLNPTNGGHAASIYTTENEWRPFGLIGVEKVHSYKASGPKYVLNVGSDLQNDIDSQSVVNVNYDLDVTTNQRIGTHLDIGHAANAAIDSNTPTKQTRLQIKDDLSAVGLLELSSIEVVKSASNSNHNFLRFIDDNTPTPNEFFKVDTEGNVSIPALSNYGLADRAWSITIFIELLIMLLKMSLLLITYQETSLITYSFPWRICWRNSSIYWICSRSRPYCCIGNTIGLINGFAYQVNLPLINEILGTPGILDAYTNTNLLIYVNGILQDSFRCIL